MLWQQREGYQFPLWDRLRTGLFRRAENGGNTGATGKESFKDGIAEGLLAEDRDTHKGAPMGNVRRQMRSRFSSWKKLSATALTIGREPMAPMA
jgi:hypothetical protein